MVLREDPAPVMRGDGDGNVHVGLRRLRRKSYPRYHLIVSQNDARKLPDRMGHVPYPTACSTSVHSPSKALPAAGRIILRRRPVALFPSREIGRHRRTPA